MGTVWHCYLLNFFKEGNPVGQRQSHHHGLLNDDPPCFALGQMWPTLHHCCINEQIKDLFTATCCYHAAKLYSKLWLQTLGNLDSYCCIQCLLLSLMSVERGFVQTETLCSFQESYPSAEAHLLLDTCPHMAIGTKSSLPR